MASSSVTSSAFLGSKTLTQTSLLPQQASFSQRSIVPGSIQPGVNSERCRLVVEAKKRRSVAERYGRQQQQGPVPQMDGGDDSPKFVIFIKTKNVNIWYPLSLVSGGTTAQMMVNIMKWDLGKKLYGGTLTRNMASVVYKDERAIQQTAIRQYPMLKGASGFEYGYKMVDKENPKASTSQSNVIKIPPKEELKTVVDKAKDFFGGFGNSVKQSTSSPSAEGEKK